MRRRGNLKIRLLIGAAVVIFAFVKKCNQQEVNPYTGKKQTINMTANQEIAIGLQSAPGMTQQHGGLYPNQADQDVVNRVGNRLVNSSIAKNTPYRYQFHLLRDPNTINAFALPGGQVFITYALYSKLQNEDQLAGVLGHEIGHVLGRHSAERIAESSFWKTISMGASVGADMGGVASQIANSTLLKNGRGDELEADDLGVRFMIASGYRPEEMIGVMNILKSVSGGHRLPEFKSTHPYPENRIKYIKEAIRKYRK